MDRSNVLTLISKSYTVDDIGQRIPVETQRTVYCDLRSVSRAEWFNGGQAGLKPELVATLFAPDYQGETIAEIATPAAGSEASYLRDSDGQQCNDANRQLLREKADVIHGTTVRYGVYRTYLGRDESIELYLERKAGITNG